jgi:riboflavin synthase
MFTGIINFLGVVISNLQDKDGKTLVVKLTKIIDSKIGDSIAIDGCCLTVIKIEFSQSVSYVTFYVSKATLDATTLGILDRNSIVNAELAMLASTPFGGHIVSGHIDEVARVIVIENIENTHTIRIQVMQENAKYLVKKGSVSVNGVSLTIMKVVDNVFDLNIIPHTLEHTNLKDLNIYTNNLVNIEYDQIIKIISQRLDAYIQHNA